MSFEPHTRPSSSIRTVGPAAPKPVERTPGASLSRMSAMNPAGQRGAYMITATPTRQTVAPMRSKRSGRNPSTAIPHASDPATKMPP